MQQIPLNVFLALVNVKTTVSYGLILVPPESESLSTLKETGLLGLRRVNIGTNFQEASGTVLAILPFLCEKDGSDYTERHAQCI